MAQNSPHAFGWQGKNMTGLGHTIPTEAILGHKAPWSNYTRRYLLNVLFR